MRIFLVKSKLSTAKKSKTTFTSFSPPKNWQFSREIKVDFLDKKWRFRTVWCIFAFQLLYLEWAKLRNWYKRQPLWLIKNYFGVKIGLYFAWLGFYTKMLIFPSIMGIICFIFGAATIFSPLNQARYTVTLFENYSKCRIWIFLILAFSTNFCRFKTDLSGNTVWPQASGFQKLAKMDRFGFLD